MSLIGLVANRILLARMAVFYEIYAIYAVTAESFSSLNLKNDLFHNHKVPTIYDGWTAQIC